MVASEGGEGGIVFLEDAEGEGEPPEKGFEDEGREEEAVCGVAAVDRHDIPGLGGVGAIILELDIF